MPLETTSKVPMVGPPDADGLSHLVQQPGESAGKLWTRFLIKKNQIVDCPDTEALVAFKHSVRDEWLARHLGQEKSKSMGALTTLMTRFCAGEDSWLARRSNSTSDPGTSEARDGNGKPRRNKHKRRNNKKIPKIWRTTPDSVALNPVSGRSHSKETKMVHPVWTEYSIGLARYMAPLICLPIIPTEIVGSPNRPVS